MAEPNAGGLPLLVAKAIRTGWRVIPQGVDKAPLVRWREFQDRAPSSEEYARWVREFPTCMWAVVTGQASGVLVADFDGEEGLDTMKRLQLTPTVLTPSGGAHVYFRAPEYAVRGGARVAPDDLPAMDLRADGQLATFYGRSPRGTYVKGGSRVRPLSDLPGAIARLIEDRRKAPEVRTSPLPEGFDDFAEAADLLVEAQQMVEEGTARNEAGFHLACQLRDERYDFEEAEGVMLRFAEAVGQSGGHVYDPQEAYNSVVSAFSAEPRAPRRLQRPSLGDGYALTDYGNAERLVAAYGDDLRYCHSWRSWLIWTGQRWARDSTQDIHRKAKQTVRQIIRDAAEVESVDHRDKLLKFARASERSARLRAMVDLAQSERGVSVVADDLDNDPWILNVANGTLDLRTAELRPNQRHDLLTKIAPVAYDENAEGLAWSAFLEQVLPDPEVRAFVQRAVGYSLTGLTSEHVAFFAYGLGANGKTTFIETVRAVLGDYAQQAPSDLLLAKRSSSVPSDVARLQGARLVTITETDEGRQLAEAVFKQLTGGDRMSARYLYAEWFEFEPVAKFWLATNHRPEVRSAGEALWRRIRLVPFDITVPSAERDTGLGRRLRGELPGVLRWAVEGCLAWQADGLAAPESVRAATQEYREQMDEIGAFIKDCCDVGDDLQAASADLYRRYEAWAAQHGNPRPETSNSFGRKLGEHGFVRRRVGKEKHTVRLGIGLRDSASTNVIALGGRR